MTRFIISIALLAVISLANFGVNAQSKHQLGFEYAINSTADGFNIVKYGVTYDNTVSPKWGFETGLLKKNEYAVMHNLVMNSVQIPLLLKYHSKFVNIAFGANSNVYLGYKNLSDAVLVDGSDIIISNSTVSGIAQINIETILKVSRDIVLGESGLTLEPSIQILPYSTGNTSLYLGAGLKLKYEF